MSERPYMKFARMWSRAWRPPLRDLPQASMETLQSEYHYVCDMLKEYFEKPRYTDLNSELLWYESMNDWLQRLSRVHHEFSARRFLANEMRKKYEQENSAPEDSHA